MSVILESTRRFTSRAATYKLFGDSELLLTIPFGRTDVVAVARVKYSNAGSLLSLLREHALIVPVLGEGKGKYRFNG